jgi:hypothetical protein
MLLSLLRDERHATRVPSPRPVIAPPSGADSLQVRQRYLRRRRSREFGTWHRTVVWVIVGASSCWLGIAVVIFGS